MGSLPLVGCFVLFFTIVHSFDFPEPPNYGWGVQTDLDRYVKSDDGYFEWTVLNHTEFENVTFYVLNMTSQKWIDETFSTRPIWWHYMGVAVPKTVKHDHVAVIFFMGGTNEDDPPHPDLVESQIAMQCAVDTGSICSYMKQVPNQPVYFYNDPTNERRTEDEVIAWSWISFKQYFNTTQHNPAYPLRNPMTKAAKRGLDTLYEFGKDYLTGFDIINFFAIGASKRGWTTWSIAMTDQRVIGIAPMVFSMIHMEESTMAHFKALGQKWSFALGPYWRENLTQYMLEPIAYMPGGLYDFEDVYRYRRRLTIPKLCIAATGDEFFLPQDFHSWWVNMTEPKYLMMLPNAEHIMAPHYIRMYETVMSFYETILLDGGTSLPRVSWSRSETTLGGEILFQTNPPPRINEETSWYDIEAWYSTTLASDDRRDFRLATDDGPHRVLWNRTEITEVSPGLFRSFVDRNLDGEWVGHFIEGTWDGPTGYRMFLTSEVNYLPYDLFPGVDCASAAECYGSLI